MGIEPEEELIAHVEDGHLVLSRPGARLRALQRELRALVPEGVSLVDELIAERRAAAKQEEAELAGDMTAWGAREHPARDA
jgi:hypothetical protein